MIFLQRKFRILNNIIKRPLFRLQSDHHRLTLNHFCVETQIWKEVAALSVERVTETNLISWLKPIFKRKHADIELVLNDEAFQFFDLPNFQQNEIASLRGIERIHKELNLEDEREMLLVDIFLKDPQTEAVILKKASILPYLETFKTCRIRLVRIAPVTFLHVNLLPWRAKKALWAKLIILMRVSLFPLVMLIIVWSLHAYALKKYEKRLDENRQLKQSIPAVKVKVVTLKTILPFIRAAMKKIAGLQMIEVDQEGNIYLAGKSSANSSIQVFDDLKSLSLLHPSSLRDWEVHQEAGENIWSVNFILQSADS